MPQEHLPTALIVTAFLTLLKCVHVEYPGIVFVTPDIRKFVGTREPIWTLFETGGSRVECKVDVTLAMNDRTVLFRRLYIYGGKKYADNQWGVLDNVYKERMRIWPEAPIRWYELRVRNSSLVTGPRLECLREFKNVLYPRRLVYSPDCQRILAYAPLADMQSK
ncbi:uncharacterized protein LOC119373911 isoform X2 [Rhipicephalus sanguineus]|uniref:uncharacterized protein LOC119373911 isoform X2 n=1 Tax=Rhipicephalus sanguineus TaxID=34632 RepID=UPI0020C2F8A9|nr:uncharacterized protein LOC119373911 isoform X2 [Rhipicephalus sanguineus]